jgi:hypothetical protein
VIPRPGSALRDLALLLAMRLAPRIPDAYGAADAGMISMLLGALAYEAESGIERRLADAAGLRVIFQTAAHAPGHDARQAFAASAPESYTQPVVSDWLDVGLELLIELHAWAELHDPALDAQIWAYLSEHTERHKLEP